MQSSLNHEQVALIREKFINKNGDREVQFREVFEKGPIEGSKAKEQGQHHVFSQLVEPQINAVPQNETALCWVYANLNLLSINFIRDNDLPPTFKFSAAFFMFYDRLEKANLFLDKIVQLKESPLRSEEMVRLLNEPTDEGGETCGFANIVNKYGLVPLDAMPHSFCMNRTKFLNRALHAYLRFCAQDLREGKGDINEMIAQVYRILAVNLGVPPKVFDWTCRNEPEGEPSKKLTPLQFALDYVKYNSDDYIELGNNPLEPYGALFEADRWRNTIEGSAHRYINIKMDTILELIGQSLDRGSPLLIASDVRNGKNDEDGIFDAKYAYNDPLYGEDRPLSREDALRYGHLEPFHMMVITGYTPQERYQILNSWSLEYGKQGYYSMSVDYARLNLYRIIIRTEFVSEEIKKIWKTEVPRQLGFKDLVL
jgi:bleomycin hydrolase